MKKGMPPNPVVEQVGTGGCPMRADGGSSGYSSYWGCLGKIF